jgi:uncharacterized protein (DUF302 family)
MKRTLLLMLALVLLGFSVIACSDDDAVGNTTGDTDMTDTVTGDVAPDSASETGDETDGETETPELTITPYSITAIVHDSNVEEVTAYIAAHLDTFDDTTDGMPDDWLVVGAEEVRELEEGASVMEAVLSLPGGDRIIEVCNKMYAGQAMSFGGIHGVALPCEISVVQEGDETLVIILNPSAIFGVFFQDVPAEHAEAMAGLAATVRSELETVIMSALNGANMDSSYENVGPVWTMEDVASFGAMDFVLTSTIDIPEDMTGSDEDLEAFKADYVATLIETLTHEHMATVGSTVPGLSVTDWRAARHYAITLPGGVSVVEMCSPTYAAAAMSTGKHHAPALPCQAAIYLDKENDHLVIDLLDPMFIFPVFFSDAPEEMMADMGGLAGAVKADLVAVVEAAIDAM